MSIVEYQIQDLLKKTYENNRILINGINILINELEENKKDNISNLLQSAISVLKLNVDIVNNIIIYLNEDEKIINLEDLENNIGKLKTGFESNDNLKVLSLLKQYILPLVNSIGRTINLFRLNNQLASINLGNMEIKKSDTILKLEELFDMIDENSMNDLQKIFFSNNHKRLHKWLHYLEIYDRHFSKYRNKDIIIVEIGVFGGGSLQMWKNYFGDKCKIIGIDIDPRCKEFEEEQIEILIGSQEDPIFLEELKTKVPKIDILIDDGGHTMTQQIMTFESLFSHISYDGVYLCEDLHTSYWENYGGGYKKEDSYIEYSKNFIDYINAWHSKDYNLKVNDFTKSAYSLHYYDSVLVIEKRKMYKPINLIKENGKISIG